MKLTTSKGATFDIDWMGEGLWPDEVMLQYTDARSMIQIVEDFSDVARFSYTDVIGREIEYKNYTRIVSVVRSHGNETVQITFAKPKE